MRLTSPHSNIAIARLLVLAVLSLCLTLAAACGGDDSTSSTPTTSAASIGASISVGGGSGTPRASDGGGSSPQATSGGGSSPLASATVTPVPGPEPAECTNAPSDAGLITQVAFGSNTSNYVPGVPIDITLILANCANNSATLHYPTSQRYDFIVADPNSVEVWRSSDGKSFDQVEGADELPPNDRITYSDTWDQKDRNGNQVPDGRYKISAFSVGCSVAPRAGCEFGPIGFVTIQSATPAPGA